MLGMCACCEAVALQRRVRYPGAFPGRFVSRTNQVLWMLRHI